MGQRKEALWRIVALLWQATVGYVLAVVIAIVGMLWMVVDIIWQLVTGRNDLSETSTPAQWVSRTLEWNVGQSIYSITGGGDGKFRLLP